MEITRLVYYSIFDSDYRLDDALKERQAAALENSIDLHIWKRKEIENYLIVPSTIARIIQKKKSEITVEEVDHWIKTKLDNMRSEVIKPYADEISRSNKGYAVSKCYEQAEKMIDSNWENVSYRIARVCGKDFLSYLSKWSQDSFGISISPMSIAKEILENEIDGEVRAVLKSINKGCSFRKPSVDDIFVMH